MSDKAKVTGKRHVVMVVNRNGEAPDASAARELIRPEVQAAAVIQKFQGDNQEVNFLIRELEAQTARVHGGDLGRPEAMLLAQAQTLEEVFCCLLRRSQANIEEGYGESGERYMRLALKAQSQCRTTLETLAEIKNPRPVAFVRQANIANGPQQVNNGAAPTEALARGKLGNQSNELSGGSNGLLPDTRASTTSVESHPTLEAVGNVHRADNVGGQEPKRTKQS